MWVKYETYDSESDVCFLQPDLADWEKPPKNPHEWKYSFKPDHTSQVRENIKGTDIKKANISLVLGQALNQYVHEVTLTPWSSAYSQNLFVETESSWLKSIAENSGLANIKGKLNSVAIQTLHLMLPQMRSGQLSCSNMDTLFRPGMFTTLVEHQYVDLPGGKAMMEQVLGGLTIK
jgi:hypothetical protein